MVFSSVLDFVFAFAFVFAFVFEAIFRVSVSVSGRVGISGSSICIYGLVQVFFNVLACISLSFLIVNIRSVAHIRFISDVSVRIKKLMISVHLCHQISSSVAIRV